MLLACSRHIPAALQTTKIIWGQGNDPQGNREKVLYFQEGTFQIYQRYCRRAASRLIYRNSIANGSHFTSFPVQGARDLVSFAVSVCLFALEMYQFPFFLHQCYQQYKAQLHVHGAGEKRHFWQTPCLEGTEAASAICRVVEKASARRTKSTSTGLGGRLVRSSGVGTPGSVWLRRP